MKGQGKTGRQTKTETIAQSLHSPHPWLSIPILPPAPHARPQAGGSPPPSDPAPSPRQENTAFGAGGVRAPLKLEIARRRHARIETAHSRTPGPVCGGDGAAIQGSLKAHSPEDYDARPWGWGRELEGREEVDGNRSESEIGN